MNRKQKIFLLIFSIAYLAYHFFTLTISPMPWFDETFFTSISHTYLNSGVFQAKVAMILNKGREIVAYGPLYFWLTSISLKIFGLGIFQFRIVCLLFGFVVFFVFYRLLPDDVNKIHFLIVFSFDTIIHSGMHGGRMDTMAVSFLLLCVYFFLRSSKDNYYQNIFLSGLFAAAALLTTPRSGIFFIPVGSLLAYRFIYYRQKEHLIGAFIWVAILISCYTAWFAYAFGNIESFLLYYKKINSLITAPFFIPKHQYPLILLSIIAILYGIIVRRKKYFSEINCISVLSIILFYLLLYDTGAYSIFIVPFYYLLIADGLGAFKMSLKDWRAISVSLLFIFSISIFIIKSIVIFSDIKNRQPSIADTFIVANIPSEKKVIGDEMFYYSVIKSSSDFQYMSWYGTDEEREKFHREQYDYDYIIWSDRLEEIKPHLFDLYSGNVRLEKTGELVLPSNDLYMISRLAGLNVSGSYNCKIYKRIKY